MGFSGVQVYVCGGFNGTECLFNAESYCPKTNQWTPIAPMSRRRSGVGVIAYKEHLYAVSYTHNMSPSSTSSRNKLSSHVWRTNTFVMCFGLYIQNTCLRTSSGVCRRFTHGTIQWEIFRIEY